jgi:hypothetical protein
MGYTKLTLQQIWNNWNTGTATEVGNKVVAMYNSQVPPTMVNLPITEAQELVYIINMTLFDLMD